MTVKRERVTVEEVAANPKDAFQVTVHGDVAISSLRIHEGGWTSIHYVNGGSCSGEPAHWHSYVRVTTD